MEEIQVAEIKTYIRSRPQLSLSDTSIRYRRQQTKVLLPNNLHIDILIIIFVKCGYRSRVADPEVNSFRLLLERYPCPRDISLDVGKEGRVFVSEVIVF